MESVISLIGCDAGDHFGHISISISPRRLSILIVYDSLRFSFGLTVQSAVNVSQL